MGYKKANNSLLFMGSTSANPAALTEYFWGNPNSAFSVSNAAVANYHVIPIDGTITSAILYQTNSNAIATAEDWTISILIGAGVGTAHTFDTIGAAGQERMFTNNNLDIAVSKGDIVRFTSTTPNWVTAPTTVFTRGFLVIC